MYQTIKNRKIHKLKCWRYDMGAAWYSEPGKEG